MDKGFDCLIFGGGGFIGSHLAKKLVSKGAKVTVFSLGNLKDNPNLAEIANKINYINGDISDRSLLNKVITKDSYVFDLATSTVPATSAHKSIDEIKPHINIFKISCRKKVKKIIFTSSGGGVYGKKKRMPITEIHHLQPSSPHSIAKATIEYLLAYYSQIYQTPYIIYRISNPYGPNQIPKEGFGLVPTLFSKVLKNLSPPLYDYGRAIRDFIYIDDLIEAISLSCFLDNKHYTYNIGSGIGRKTIEVWQIIKTITGSPLSPTLLPKREFDIKRYVLDIKRFSSEFNWTPKTELNEGLQKTWEWIRNNQIILSE